MSDVYHSVQPIFIIFNLLGFSQYFVRNSPDNQLFLHSTAKPIHRHSIHPLNTDEVSRSTTPSEPRLQWSPWLLLLNLITIALQWAAAVYGYINARSGLTNIAGLVEGIQTGGNLLLIAVTPISYWRHGRLLADIINALHADIDRHLRVRVDHSAMRRRQLLAGFALLTELLLNMCGGIFMTLQINAETRLILSRVIVFGLGLLNINMQLLTLYVFAAQLRERYQRLDAILTASWPKTPGAEQVEEEEKDMQVLRMYNRLWQLCRLLNDFCNGHVLMQFAMAYMFILAAGFFFAYTGLALRVTYMLLLGMWMAHYLLMTGIPVWMLHSTTVAAEAVRTKLSARHKSMMVQQQLVFQDNTFRVYQLFPVNLNYSLVMIGSVSTNLLILWQFQRMMHFD